MPPPVTVPCRGDCGVERHVLGSAAYRSCSALNARHRSPGRPASSTPPEPPRARVSPEEGLATRVPAGLAPTAAPLGPGLAWPQYRGEREAEDPHAGPEETRARRTYRRQMEAQRRINAAELEQLLAASEVGEEEIDHIREMRAEELRTMAEHGELHVSAARLRDRRAPGGLRKGFRMLARLLGRR